MEYVSEIEQYVQKRGTLITVLGLFILLNVVNLNIVATQNPVWIKGFYFLTAWCGTILILSISIKLACYHNKIVSYIQYMGRQSMTFYVMHLVFLAGMRIVLLKILGAQHLWMIAIVITFASLLLCSIGLWIIRKMKLSKILF